MRDKYKRFQKDPKCISQYNQARQLLFEAGVDEVMQEVLMDFAKDAPLGDAHAGCQHASMMAGFASAVCLMFDLLQTTDKGAMPKASWNSKTTGPRRLPDAAITD